MNDDPVFQQALRDLAALPRAQLCTQACRTHRLATDADLRASLRAHLAATPRQQH